MIFTEKSVSEVDAGVRYRPSRSGQQLTQARDLVIGLAQHACQQGIFVLESPDPTLAAIFRLSHAEIVDFCARVWRRSLKIN
jgi:hypothetical protein